MKKRGKLTQQKSEPYKVIDIHAGGRAIKLELPPSLDAVHPVVSIQHVEKCRNPAEDPWKRTETENPGPVDESISENQDEYECIVVDEKTTRGGNAKFKVHYTGWDPKYDEWLVPSRISVEAIKAWRTKPGNPKAEAYAATPEEANRAQPKTWDELRGESFPTIKPRAGQKLERPVCYISRVTTSYEKNYQATELELCCIAWAFAKLSHMLEGSKVEIVTDHQAVKGVLNSAPGTRYSIRLDKARMSLMPFLNDITITYREGTKMQMVDPLSRASYSERPRDSGPADSGVALAKRAWNAQHGPAPEDAQQAEAIKSGMTESRREEDSGGRIAERDEGLKGESGREEEEEPRRGQNDDGGERCASDDESEEERT